jgi:hypothetical protein
LPITIFDDDGQLLLFKVNYLKLKLMVGQEQLPQLIQIFIDFFILIHMISVVDDIGCFGKIIADFGKASKDRT